MLMILKIVVLMVGVMLATAFFTLLEHKILGFSQIRKGPSKVGFFGILQPFSDALKLLAKELFFPLKGNYLTFILGPVFSLVSVLMVWTVVVSNYGVSNMVSGILFFLCCLSFSVYTGLSAGWSSNSKYSMIGSLRSVAQTISYEVVLALLVVCLVLFLGSYSFHELSEFNGLYMLFGLIPFLFMWVVTCLAESNRTPFDFSEGESELVSGFNTEFSSSSFVLIFLAEYMSILFLSGLSVFFFIGLGGGFITSLIFCVFLGSFFVWVRSTLPRFRYDKLMMLAWKVYLPVVLSGLVVIMTVKVWTW